MVRKDDIRVCKSCGCLYSRRLSKSMKCPACEGQNYGNLEM